MGGRRLARGLLLIQGALGLAALVVLALQAEAPEPMLAKIAAGLAAAGLAGTAALAYVLARRDGGLDRLRRVLAFAARRDRAPDEKPPADPDIAVLVRLAEAVHLRRADDDRLRGRFGAVIGALKGGIVLLSPAGQISLVNRRAREALGPDRARIGASIFSALNRDDLLSAIALADQAKRPLHAQVRTLDERAVDLHVSALSGNHGTLLTVEAGGDEWLPGCDHALEIHDIVPTGGEPPAAETVLADIPATVLDTETTGLDVGTDKIVQIAALRMHGERIYPADSIERIVNPMRPIPPGSTAVHGITDDIARRARPFADIWREVEPYLANRVVVGHNIRFDLALLRRAAEAAGLPWVEPPWLCTARLAEALEPEQADFNLASVAARLDVEATGLHTAMGDVLVTAEVFKRQIALLRGHGVGTLGEAVAFSNRARRLAAAQRDSGW